MLYTANFSIFVRYIQNTKMHCVDKMQNYVSTWCYIK